MRLERLASAVETDYLRKKSRPIVGCVLGILGGGMFSLFATFRYILQGTALFERIGVPFEKMIGLYLVGGAVSGTLVGILLPLTIRPLGAAFVGSIAALPLYLGAAFLLGYENFRLVSLAAVLIGGVSGVLWWEPLKKPPK